MASVAASDLDLPRLPVLVVFNHASAVLNVVRPVPDYAAQRRRGRGRSHLRHCCTKT